MTFYNLFKKTVEKYPDKVAIIFEGLPYTYAQIDKVSDIIAEKLVASSLKSGELVGINLERSPLMVMAIIAVIKANGAYVPLDPIYPKQRLDYMIKDSDMKYVIYSSEPSVDKLPIQALDISNILAIKTNSCFNHTPKQLPANNDLAYLIYTSGSTGNPKGVKITHFSLNNFFAAMRKIPGITKNDVLLAITTFSFDISILELLLPLTVGATIVLAAYNDTRNGDKLSDLLYRYNATIMQATPSTWRMMVSSGWVGNSSLKALCGGEALDNKLAKDLYSRVGELWNMYGPTETTIWSSCCKITSPSQRITIGKPILNTQFYILDKDLHYSAQGQIGTLYIGGHGVALGYNNPYLDQDRFINYIDNKSNKLVRLYNTGDLAQFLENEEIKLIGRADTQIKIKGFRVELGEIEEKLKLLSGVKQAIVVDGEHTNGSKFISAFLLHEKPHMFDVEHIIKELLIELPPYMVPSYFNLLNELPLLPNGKIDRNAVKNLLKKTCSTETKLDLTGIIDKKIILEKIICACTNLDLVEHDCNLFEIGIDSLLINKIASLFAKYTNTKVNVAGFFLYPSINQYIEHHEKSNFTKKIYQQINLNFKKTTDQGNKIAIIGMSGRFPGANNIDELWDIIAKGKETVTHFSQNEDDPIIDSTTLNDPSYVRSRGIIKDPEWFDANLFDINPYDAVVMDPQQRVFLELAWEALEHSGYDPEQYKGEIGVFAGMGNNFYYFHNIATNPELIKMVGEVQTEIGREKDHIATQVSHKLNLTGPSLSIHTACSTGLVAVDEACHRLLAFQCDIALAGAIEIKTPQMSGEIHKPGGIFTSDGHCRPFSNNASGTMFSDGAGIVVLKRFDDAVRDRDTIHAVILGAAVNHDGSEKNSYLAPSVKGQMRVIMTALKRANISPSSVSYVEAHGTGTSVGDPIEFNALENVFKFYTDHRNYCALGSIKGNLGHPTTAAGIVGLIKCVMSLKHKKIPPLINFNQINPNIDIENSPFFINTKLIPWKPIEGKRRCAVSSFGFCGTNAHVILEEHVEKFCNKTKNNKAVPIFLISAKTKTALEKKMQQLRDYLSRNNNINPTDVAYTYCVGRKRMPYKGILIDKYNNFNEIKHKFSETQSDNTNRPIIAFMFPGQGAQYINMGKNLYETEAVFKTEFDRCADILLDVWGTDIKEIIFSNIHYDTGKLELLNNTYYTQPAIFCIEYALAKLWIYWGIKPDVMIGHSIGEFVCGVLSGIFSLKDALMLISVRGSLINKLDKGGMLSVKITLDKLTAKIGDEFSIAAINSSDSCVISGRNEDIDAIKTKFDQEGIISRRLKTSHAFHSWMMEPALVPFEKVIKKISIGKINIPIISTVTGELLTDESIQNKKYWINHIKNTVNFLAAIKKLWENKNCILLEIGPRSGLTNLAISEANNPNQIAVPTLASNSEDNAEHYALSLAVGELWLKDIELNWNHYFNKPYRRRIPLPLYPFERKKYWALSPTKKITEVQKPIFEDLIMVGESIKIDVPQKKHNSSHLNIRTEIFNILKLISGRNLDIMSTGNTFFELGIDSLLLTALIFKLKEKFKIDISFRQLINNYNTLESLSDYISKQLISPDLVLNNENPYYFPSSQLNETTNLYLPMDIQKFYLMRTKEPDGALVNINSVTINIEGMIVETFLKDAISVLIKHHDALRIQFNQGLDSFSFVPHGLVNIEVIHLGNNSIDKLIEENMRTAFIYEKNFLFRVNIIIINAKKACVIFSADYSICDKWSMDILIEEYLSIYSSLITSANYNLSSAPQYSKFYLPPSDTLLNLNATQWAIKQTSSCSFTLNNNTLVQLKSWCAQYKLTLFTFILAAISYLLHSQDKTNEQIIIIPISGQTISNQLNLVGQCTKLAAISSQKLWTNHFIDYVFRIEDVLIETYQNHVENLKFTDLTNDGTNTNSNSYISFTHMQRLPDKALNHHKFQADYNFNRRPNQIFKYEYELIEDKDKIIIDCSFHNDVNKNQVILLMEQLKELMAQPLNKQIKKVDHSKNEWLV